MRHANVTWMQRVTRIAEQQQRKKKHTNGCLCFKKLLNEALVYRCCAGLSNCAHESTYWTMKCANDRFALGEPCFFLC